MNRSAFATALLVVLLAAAALAALPAQATATARGVVLVLGDSLSAEYGLPRGAGWVRMLSDRLRQNGADYTVVNASISGETTSGGRTRLPALLKEHRPNIVVLQLGANDGLRGLPLNAMQDNLEAMIRLSRDAGGQVLLVGIRVPPNYGRQYADRFYATFETLAQRHKVGLAPFLLDGFAESAEMFQSDRIHPGEQAQPRMLDNVWPALKPLLERKS